MSEWSVVLNGVLLSGGGDTSSIPVSGGVTGFLSEPPDGMGVPALRTEDQSFPQRDGVAHYADWYEPRTITLSDVSVVPEPGCPTCPSARAKARDLTKAWDRQCGDVEMVIYTDCHGTDPDRSLVGPFGVIGRPRVASLTWMGQGIKAAQATLRFDSVDHRLYILDAAGTPGSGWETVTADPSLFLRSYISEISADSPERYWRLNQNSGASTSGSVVPTLGGAAGTFSNPGQFPSVWGRAPLAPGLLASAATSSTNRGGNSISLPMLAQDNTSTLEFWASVSPTTPNNGVLVTSATVTVRPNYVSWGSQVRNLVTPIPLATARHFVLVQNGATISLYINGAIHESWTTSGTTLAASTLVFGGSPVSATMATSDVAVYNTALDASRVQAHYVAGMQAASSTPFNVSGNVCVPIVLTIGPSISSPTISFPDGRWVGSNIGTDSASTIEIDTANGTATMITGSSREDVTYSITGDPFLSLSEGSNSFAVVTESFSPSVSYVALDWRPAVISG